MGVFSFGSFAKTHPFLATFVGFGCNGFEEVSEGWGKGGFVCKGKFVQESFVVKPNPVEGGFQVDNLGRGHGGLV